MKVPGRSRKQNRALSNLVCSNSVYNMQREEVLGGNSLFNECGIAFGYLRAWQTKSKKNPANLHSKESRKPTPNAS